MRRACATTIPHEVRGAAVEPPAIRVVRVVMPVSIKMMLNAMASRLIHIQVVTQRHTAAFDDPGCLVLALASLVDEAFWALCGSLIALLLILQPLILLRLQLFLPFVIFTLLLNLFLVWRLLLSGIIFILLLLLLLVLWDALALGLLLRGRHGEFVCPLALRAFGIVLTKPRAMMILLLVVVICTLSLLVVIGTLSFLVVIGLLSLLFIIGPHSLLVVIIFSGSCFPFVFSLLLIIIIIFSSLRFIVVCASR